ncbi:MAG: type II CAAX endopeptidase family protein [Acidobacteriota bacterium]
MYYLNQQEERKSWIPLLLFFMVGVSFLIPGILHYRKAFPESSIDFKISRNEAYERAEEFLRKRGIDIAGYLRSIRFDYDFEGKIFLERDAGFGETVSSAASEEVKIWRWEARWFKPHQKVEYRLYISPDGQISGYQRILPEDAAKEDLGASGALKIAEDFLTQDVGFSLSNYALIEQSFRSLQSRTDYFFTWERTNFRIADATYRVTVTVQGNEVGSFHQFLNLPEEWRRAYSRMTSRNDLLQNITFLATLPLFIAIPVLLLLRMRRHDIRWRVGAFLALTLFTLYLLQGMNSIPIFLTGFDTLQSIGSFAGRVALQTIILALTNAALIFIIASVSESLYREQFPRNLSLSRFFSLRFFRTREFFSAAMAGYSMTSFHIGFVVLFYFMGKKVGVWSPAEVGYTDALSTWLPWIYPLTASLTASFMEELIFRVFAILLLRKFLPTWMAVVIPAFLWGFLHSNYPQQPCFIRGLEVGLIGIMAGYIFLRWGIFATLIWHYSIDALFIGLFLFSSSNPYFIISGVFVVGLLLFPMILSLFTIAGQRRLEKETGMWNADEPGAEDHYETGKQLAAKERFATEEQMVARVQIESTEPLEAREWIDARGQLKAEKQHELEGECAAIPGGEAAATMKPLLYVPISLKKYLFLTSVIILSIVILSLIRELRSWPETKVAITSSQAKRLAQDYLEKREVDTSSFNRATSFETLTGGYDDRYIQNVSGWEGLRMAYRLFKDTARWKVRFFTPLLREEYVVSMNERGEDLYHSHIIPEEREAPLVTSIAAREQAERFLQGEKKIPLEDYSLVDSYEDKKPKRVDHHFTWKWDKKRPGDGEYRISASVTDNEVTGYSKFIKIPEEWKIKDEEEGLQDIIFLFLKMVLIASACGFAVALVVRDFMHGKIDWRIVLAVSLLAMASYFIRELNRASTLFYHYETSIPVSSYLSYEILNLVLHGLGIFIATLVISGATLSLWRDTEPGRSPFPDRSQSVRGYFKDSILLGFSSLFIFLAASRLFGWLDRTIDIPRSRISTEHLPGIDTFFPFLEVISTALIIAASLTPAVFFGFLLFRRYLKKVPYFYGVALPVTAILLLDRAKSVPEFLFIFSTTSLAVLMTFQFLRECIRENILALFVSLMFIGSLPRAAALLSQPLAFYKFNGILILALTFLPILMLCAFMLSIDSESRSNDR